MKDESKSADLGWVPDAIFYQIFPDRFYNGDSSNDPAQVEPWGNPPTRENFFGGDLKGIIKKLDYLQDLGINALYLTPVFLANTNHKYDTRDYYQIDPAFGDKQVFGELVAAVHSRKMRIVLDGVFNHCGDQFWAFADVKEKGKESPYWDWFFVNKYPLSTDPLSYFVCGTAEYLPKLNVSNRVVRDYLCDVGRYWLEEFSVDGWRLDSACKLPLSFWRGFQNAVRQRNPDVYLFGEIWREASAWVVSSVFDGATNYPLRSLMLDFFANTALDAEDFLYEVSQLYERLGEAAFKMVNFLGNHDTPRSFTVFGGDFSLLASAVVFLFTAIGIPMVYYGDEVGMCGEADPDCRRTMIWDQSFWDKRINSLYKNMIQLRKNHVALRSGAFEPLISFGRMLAFRRFTEGDEVIVLLNPGKAVENIRVPTKSVNECWRDCFTEEQVASSGGSLRFDRIDAKCIKVLSC